MSLPQLQRKKPVIALFLALFLALPSAAWAALPTVVINSAGSNTAASGAGPATALHGTAASTAASTTVTLLTDNPDLSGVATDGSAVLWVGSSSGRQFSKITGVNNTAGVKTVTVAVAYANTESGKNWGIGGKRASMAGSSLIFSSGASQGDWDNGWTVDVQTGETISAAIRFVGPAASLSISSPLVTSTTFTTWGTQPVIQTSTNSIVMMNVSGSTSFRFENLSFKTTAGTPGVCFQPTNSNGSNINWRNCIFDGFVMAFDGSNGVGFFYGNGVIDRCEVKNCTGPGSSNSAAISWLNGGLSLTNSYIHDNAGALLLPSPGTVTRCVFANNRSGTGTVGTIVLGLFTQVFTNNSIYNCDANNSTAGTAVYFGRVGGTAGTDITHENNIYYGCAGYAVNSITDFGLLSQNNAYGGNNGAGTGLNLSQFPSSASDITLSANPYTSTVTPDYGLNSAAGGGVLCKAAAVGNAGASANTAGDLGAIPSGGGAAAGAGGGKKVGPGGGKLGMLDPRSLFPFSRSRPIITRKAG